MASSVLGIHHVTAIAGDSQQTIDFYTQVLGLRLVVVTVDVHDTETYLLVFAAGTGEPGMLLSFYCWPGAIRGRSGTGQVQSAGLSVPPGSLHYWRDRLTSRHVSVDDPARREGVESLSFRDRDGLLLELVVDDTVKPQGDTDARPIPTDRAILGLHHITISAGSSADWDRFLTTVLGLVPTAEGSDNCSYAVEGGGSGAQVVVRAMPCVGRGITTVGFVHHAAFSVPNHELDAWRSRLAQYTETLSPADDHAYYRALHLEGPEGVRLELASDRLGIAANERSTEPGTHVVLPPWLEPRRTDIERQLPPLQLPGGAR